VSFGCQDSRWLEGHLVGGHFDHGQALSELAERTMMRFSTGQVDLRATPSSQIAHHHIVDVGNVQELSFGLQIGRDCPRDEVGVVAQVVEVVDLVEDMVSSITSAKEVA